MTILNQIIPTFAKSYIFANNIDLVWSGHNKNHAEFMQNTKVNKITGKMHKIEHMKNPVKQEVSLKKTDIL